MSIRFRLLISYLAMILVPIFFVVISALLVALLFRGDFNELRNIYIPPEHHHQISSKDQLLLNLQRQSLKNSGEFTNISYLNQIDKQLEKSGSALVVKRSNKVIYKSHQLSRLDIEDLPLFGEIAEVDPFERVDHRFVSIQKIDFFFPDQTEGSLYFVTDASGLAKFVRASYPLLFIGLIVILIVTNGLLTYFVSRSIIRPIRNLQRSARLMKEGNLNVPIKATSKDELGQLAQSFDEMREKLKESIEQQLVMEANRKELIANISHDLKTPITTIKGYVEGIRDGVANSQEKIDRYIQTIYSKSNDLDPMIDELFLYSKLDLQRLPFHFEKIPFDDYLRDYVEELRFDVEEMNVEIHLNIEKNRDYYIMVDREHLKRVITNIVENSMKYIETDHKILGFHLSSESSAILLRIVDNGPGIDEANLPYIFERFYRADLARGTEKGGSGLGLSIARRIIEEHHGSIWAESIKGQGTSIFIRLNKAGGQVETHSNY
jgi:signal transduction histidine kinase